MYSREHLVKDFKQKVNNMKKYKIKQRIIKRLNFKKY